MEIYTYSKLKLLIIGAILVLALISNFANAKKLALIIGNSEYINSTELLNPQNDANDLAKLLKDDLDFEVTLGLELATKTDIENLFREFVQQITPDDYIVFYFSGHGAQIDGENYLVPTHASFDNFTALKEDSVSVTNILNRLQKSESQVTIAILDACRNLPNIPQTDIEQPIGLARISKPNTLIAFSAASGKLASDGRTGERNSPFVQQLKEHISNTNLDVTNLFAEVRRGVSADTSKRQTPEIVNNLDEQIFLSDETAFDLVEVNFQILPLDAEIFIDDQELSSQKGNYRKGDYSLRLQKEGYEPIYTTITIGNTQDKQIVRYQLTPIKSRLNVTTEPSGAGVFLVSDENQLIEETPIQEYDLLSPGKYEIKIELAGYQEIIKTIELLPGKSLSISEKMERLKGIVKIESQPSGAKIFLDDAQIGITPMNFERAEGNYEFVFELEGYKKGFQSVTLYSGETITVKQPLEIAQTTGKIFLRNTFPADAEIRLDNTFAGTGSAANGNLSKIPPGTRRILIRKEGYENTEIVLLVEAGAEYPLDFNLIPKKAILKIETIPSVDAMVYIDELPISSLPNFEEKLEHGKYNIKLIANGYEPHQQLVDLKMGEVLPLSIPLKAKITVGILDIRSNPPGAAVYFNDDDDFTAITPFTIKKLAGIQNIRFNKFGYTELTITHDIKAGQKTIINEALDSEKEATTIEVKSSPENIRVFIDGGYVGLTNFETPIPIDFGKHTIEFRHPDFTEQIEVEVLDGIPLLVDKDFTKLHVDFEINPDFAELYIDDIRQESRSLELNEGIYSVRVSSEGYETQESELVVQKGKNEVVKVNLENQKTILTINASPPNANILIDNEPLTINPVELYAGIYKVVASASGYATVEETVILLPGKQSTIDLNLKQLLGKLVLDTNQSLYEVKIQGDNYTYNNQQVFILTEGKYEVTVRAPNMIEQSFIANVVAGEDFLQRIEFQPLEAYTQQPSFDCAKAIKWSEKALCSNERLATLDVEMSDAYTELRTLLDSSEMELLITEQRAWLQIRDYCESNEDNLSCLVDLMTQRTLELQGRFTAKLSEVEDAE